MTARLKTGNKSDNTMVLKRKSYTTAFKLDAVKFCLEHGTSAAAAHYQVDERLIRRWKAEKENLQKLPPTKRSSRFGKPKAVEIDEALYSWIVRRKNTSRAVMIKDIKAKAIELAKECGRQDFKASSTWCKSFMKRSNLAVQEEPSSVDYCQAFMREFVEETLRNLLTASVSTDDEHDEMKTE